MNDKKENWHLKKEIGITHLLTSFAMILTAVWWVSGMETRMAVTETKVHAIEKTIGKLESYLIRIESKVDNIKR